jgi:hypothetical protein
MANDEDKKGPLPEATVGRRDMFKPPERLRPAPLPVSRRVPWLPHRLRPRPSFPLEFTIIH